MRRLTLLLLAGAACAPAPKPRQAATPIARAEDAPAEAPKPPGAKPKPPLPKLQIALSGRSACVRVKGSLYCWERSAPPKKLPITQHLSPLALEDVTDVGLGYDHTCALAKGRVYCWGGNEHGQLGAGLAELRRGEPVRVAGIESAKALAVGRWHTCALGEDGSVSCWGWNSAGQTGSDTEYAPAARELATAEPVAGLTRVSALRAGRDQTCALAGDGWSCFGRAYLASQRRAKGYQNNEAYSAPELESLVQLSLHDETACGLFDGGKVACWGSGAFSLLTGRPLNADGPLPVELAGALEVTVGPHHACAILSRGRVSCWGIDSNGKLGRGRVLEGYDPHGPEEIPGLGGVTALALDVLGTCAVTDSSELYCWGHLPHLAGDKPSPSPVKVPLW